MRATQTVLGAAAGERRNNGHWQLHHTIPHCSLSVFQGWMPRAGEKNIIEYLSATAALPPQGYLHARLSFSTYARRGTVAPGRFARLPLRQRGMVVRKVYPETDRIEALLLQYKLFQRIAFIFETCNQASSPAFLYTFRPWTGFQVRTNHNHQKREMFVY